MISGDNELAALDFQKHYRMPAVYLMDPDRSFERKYNRRGWPFLMLVDDEGTVRYKCNGLVDSDKALMGHLQEIVKTPRKPATQLVGGIPYLTTTLEQNGEIGKSLCNERFTSVACGKTGDVYTAFTSVRNGQSDVYLRIQRDGGEPQTLAVAAANADEYDATVIVDPTGEPWLCWTTNRLGQIYNVYLSNLSGIRSGKPPIAISQSREDAMHGRMAADASGGIWVTYYKWEKMRGISRDKEVYVRRYANGAVSNEIHVSPDDVSVYEDHTDPVIAMVNNHPVVCWSWDFHRPKGYTQQAATPTIFARRIGSGRVTGKAFDVSAKSIDSTPTLGVCGNSLWCAWDSLSRRKSISVRRIATGGTSESPVSISNSVVNVCSPNIAFFKDTKGVLIWSQTENGIDWSLWKADYDVDQSAWSKPSRVISEGNPRFGSCAYDSQGRLWLAYSFQNENGRQIIVEPL